MRLHSRKIFDRSFSFAGILAIILMTAALVVILAPIVYRGLGAYIFRATYEHRRAMFELFEQGSEEKLRQEHQKVEEAREPIYRYLRETEFEIRQELLRLSGEVRELLSQDDLDRRLERSLNRRLERMGDDPSLENLTNTLERIQQRLEGHDEEAYSDLISRIEYEVGEQEEINEQLSDLRRALRRFMGPLPGDRPAELRRNHYGQTRWDRAQEELDGVLYRYEWDYSDAGQAGTRKRISRIEDFQGTQAQLIFPYIEENAEKIMRPRLTFYWRFLTNTSRDSHFFGGIWAEALGTFYLTIGAMLFAVPMGIIAAIYLCEYARPSRTVSLLRSCISTLAGVPSIVFGLFGLAFFLNTIQVSDSKSVLAGSLTLALMILPTVIRASEEAILAVPKAYKEASLALGSGRWHTVLTVILPAALPGIITGIVISMGRAAGETAPIIFTAAVSVGRPLKWFQTLNNPSPALPWNIYNLATEHEAVDQIRHVQFGMVFTLVAIVLILNLTAIILRARISKKLRG